ncbi:MAG: 16S rRNA processing protein RimM [Myxococcales bacterium]|nr:16S rRNA processing protein RimM [Myxococcales bacterium]
MTSGRGARGDDPWVALGAIARPHGVRGEVRVFRYNPESTLLLDQSRVWLAEGGEHRPIRVLAARIHGDMVLLTLQGVGDRDAAEALRGVEVCVGRDALPPPEEDEVYHVDLVGLNVVDETGSPVGSVSDVIRYPSVDCLVVEGEDGVREIPLLDPYVVEVRLEEKRVVVANLEDLDVTRPG